MELTEQIELADKVNTEFIRILKMVRKAYNMQRAAHGITPHHYGNAAEYLGESEFR